MSRARPLCGLLPQLTIAGSIVALAIAVYCCDRCYFRDRGHTKHTPPTSDLLQQFRIGSPAQSPPYTDKEAYIETEAYTENEAYTESEM